MPALPGLVIHGAGRMGQLVAENLSSSSSSSSSGFELAGIVSPSRPDWAGDLPWFTSLSELPGDCAVLIDFSRPTGTASAAKWCASQGTAMVSGTTGLEPAEFDELRNASRQVPVLWAANFSVGVNVVQSLLESLAPGLGEETKVTVHDIHHVHKLDAPSGTALVLGAATAVADVEYESIREGEVVGEHHVRFQNAGDTREVSHLASDRNIYAIGALQAAGWLSAQSPGLYSASDWLAG